LGSGDCEDVSNGADIEQIAQQENKDCEDGSTCGNQIASGTATASGEANRIAAFMPHSVQALITTN